MQPKFSPADVVARLRAANDLLCGACEQIPVSEPLDPEVEKALRMLLESVALTPGIPPKLHLRAAIWHLSSAED
jgi:hypothetical protein